MRSTWSFAPAFFLAALFVTNPAQSSSNDAWAALFKTATTACQTASGLKDARAAGQPVDFTDRVLVVVTGRWPQPHMKNKQAKFACLYEKIGGKTEAAEMLAK
jgi:hypothetical protein